MKRKHIIVITVSVISAFVLIAGLIFACFWCMLHTLPGTRRKIYDYYSSAEFVTVYGKIQNLYSDKYGLQVTVEFDESWLLTLSENERRDYGIYNNKSERYAFPPKSEAVLKDNALFVLLEAEQGTVTNEMVFAFQINPSIWWDGGEPFAVSVSAGDKVYLDIHTGKDNLLDYIQNDMP